jgi:hypothetical protein
VRTCPPGARRDWKGRCLIDKICPLGQTLVNGNCVSTYQPPSIGRNQGRLGNIGSLRRQGRGRYRSDGGIIEYFQNTISSETPKLFNYKFLVIVIIVIIIAIIIYIMREQNL